MNARLWRSLFGLFTAAFLLLDGCPGCDEEDGDSAEGDDDDDGVEVAEIEATEPQDGSTSFYHRNDIIVEFDEAPAEASIALADGDGAVITGEVTTSDNGKVLTFDPHGESATEHLLPSTDYVATITWQDHDPVALGFATSDVGTPVDDPQNDVVGHDYFLDLGSAKFTEPPGIGSLLSQYIADVYLLFHVVAIDEEAGTIDVFGTLGGAGGSQDMCDETLPMTDEQPGLWDNPYMQIGPTDLTLDIEGEEATITDLQIGGSFTSDGLELVGGTFDGQLDTRMLDEIIDPGAEEGAACELLASLGIACEECPDGSGPWCLTVSAYDILAEEVDVLAVDPETGEEYDTLQEVTAEDVEAWTAEGYCP